MLKQHSQIVLTMFVLADACAVALAWLLSYYLRFNFLYVDPAKGVPELHEKFLPALPLVVLAHILIFHRMGLYEPHRDRSILSELQNVVKAFIVAVVAVVLIDFAMPGTSKVSRLFVLTYAVVGTAFFALFRTSVRVTIRALRQRGLNHRSAAIIGAGRNAQRLLHAFRRNTWTGIDVVYFVDDMPPGGRATVRNLPVYGPISATAAIIERHPVDCVFIALPTEEANRLDEVLEALEHNMTDVRLVPEIDPAFTMRPDVSELDGLPVLSLRQTPLQGWNAFLKRLFDLAVGSACLLIAAPAMLLIAALIRLTSAGPVLYRQRRMGFDGREFDMLKFRTMRVDAEAGGPVWSRKSDDRRTPLGAFLRRTSLDELPNLFNVLAGHMSLVGPRPERPEFIEKFKREIPRYMLRHKMKAGMTGYAQVHGYRGETSLQKRIQYDLYYIRNWSLGLDLRILTQTVGAVWFSRHEA